MLSGEINNTCKGVKRVKVVMDNGPQWGFELDFTDPFGRHCPPQMLQKPLVISEKSESTIGSSLEPGRGEVLCATLRDMLQRMSGVERLQLIWMPKSEQEGVGLYVIMHGQDGKPVDPSKIGLEDFLQAFNECWHASCLNLAGRGA